MTDQSPCSCDRYTGECQGPLGCKAINSLPSLVKALEEAIAFVDEEEDDCVDLPRKTRLIALSKRLCAALSSYRGEGK